MTLTHLYYTCTPCVFREHVTPFMSQPTETVLHLVQRMSMSNFPPGKEWEPASDQQIYFMSEGALLS